MRIVARLHKAICVIALLGAASAATAARSDEVRDYDWLTNGVKSGSLKVIISDDGSRTAHFEFNDRGRGPKITETTVLDEQGRVIRLDISGHSYMGAPVDEHFERGVDSVRWKSALEEGSTTSQTALYLPNDGTPVQRAMLARALLESPSRSRAMLPSGTARIEALKEVALSEGDTGQVVSLYAISGLETTPRFVWLDEQGQLFGMVQSWTSLVPAGKAGLVGQLREAQDQAELKYYADQSVPLTHVLPNRYALNNIHVVDVLSGSIMRNRAVVVSDGRVEAIVAAGQTTGEFVIDGKGGWLMPGLWDMHSHISQDQGLLHMAAGVTTIRDMGNNPELYFDVKRRFDEGKIVGPRSVAAGFVDRKSPYSAPIKVLAESLQEALELVDKYAGMGYPQIKIYSSIEPDWVKPIAERVHGHGMRLSGHIPSYMTAERAIKDGFNEIQHINMLFLNFLAGPQDDTRTPVRFTLVAEHGGSLDLESEQAAAFFTLLKENDITVDPTVAIFDNMFRHRSGELSPSYAMVADHFPPAMKRGMLAGRMNINETNAARYAGAADAMLVMIRKLYEHEIRIVAGTDALPGFTLHRELELYVRAGIPNSEVLRLATLGSAQHMGMSGSSGSISPGKLADMVLLHANPLDDISAIRGAKMVFRGDRYFNPAEMYRAVGIEPFD